LNKLHLYVLAVVLAALGLGLFVYKAYVLGFPLAPRTKVQVWNVEARMSFVAQDKPVKLSMFIPSSTRRFAIADEHFISSGYGIVASVEEGNRKAVWSIRQARREQNIYYQAVVRAVRTKAPRIEEEAPEATSPGFEGPHLEAARSLIAATEAKSADTRSFVAELIKRLNRIEPGDNVALLLGPKPGLPKKVEAAVRVLSQAGIPARVVQGIRLQEEKHDFSKKTNLLHWLEVYDKNQWLSFDPLRGKTPVPDDWLPWWRGPQNLVNLEGGTKLNVVLSVSPKIEEGITAAVLRGEISKPLLLKLSLFSLPVNTQAVYRVMLLVPIGAFILVILRNIVGIKTFGTFMPVLIALSFRETGLLWGIFLFAVIVATGLAIRFYMERLKLLLVPRLAAVLIVVVLLLAAVSVLTNSLGIHSGLSVALFPMVILTMTIERMSIVWEERGPGEALVSGFGSLMTAALVFLVMNVKFIEHLVFVFPELLLVLLAATLLLGRYSGYRLMDLYRFKALAKG
jgi:7 transmembrane helices usually fused to an inactive transglutaminase/Inactive transglutaminase fused to 7 transmembrane helices/Transglutaminase-like superfamily